MERDETLGGMCRCIPELRLDRTVLESDINWLLSLGDMEVKLGAEVKAPEALLGQGFDAVVVAVGLWDPIKLRVRGVTLAGAGIDLLKDPAGQRLSGHVMVVGGGATAFDTAMAALAAGADTVELVALETLGEMPLTGHEREALWASGVDVSGRTRVTRLEADASGALAAVHTEKVTLAAGRSFALDAISAVPGTETVRRDVSHVLLSIGLRCELPRVAHERVFYAGDCAEGPTTVVEAVAAGKNAAQEVLALLNAEARPEFPRLPTGRVKSRLPLPGYNARPVPLNTAFFGRPIRSPFLLSAAPPTDGLDQVVKAYEAGWSGVIMKTAFDGVPIHIPAEYMFTYSNDTYANCDNVSGHPLDRVCREVDELVRRYPDRLTLASTGGPLTGDDQADRAGWVGNTHKLESTGVMGIEYSLSCPQGGDGTEGDIVSQNAALTAKVVDWILSGGDPSVPKLFKLTGAVTAVETIVQAILEVLARYPEAKAGITLANSFPTLAFRESKTRRWDEGIVAGASGAGILPISYLSLAKVAPLGITISGNGGPMEHRAAANFLALGCRTVQFCTLVTRFGVGVVDDLESGVSHLMAARGMSCMDDLIGAALPEPITDFMDLPDRKKISDPNHELCLQCGNCTRCPYLAITMNEDGAPVSDPSRCVGCGICALKCFARAIDMRERTPEEAAALSER